GRVTGGFLTADWRYLALLHFEVDPSVLSTLVPKGTELDDKNGRHLISLVGFLFLDTHVLGVPAFFHRDFEEVNLRFYVRRGTGETARHGVVFIREMVPLPLVAGAARLTYNEPYRTVPMRHTIVETAGELQSVDYRFGGPHDECRLALHGGGEPHPLVAGPDEGAFSARGRGYTK